MPEGYGYPKGKEILGKGSQGELGSDVAKRPNEKLTINPKKKYANEYKRKVYTGGASEKMKSEVTEAATRAKKERDTLQAQHIIPKGRLSKRPGPHKRSHNRISTENLLGFLPKQIKEGIIKYADKFDEKQIKKSEAKQSNKKEKERQKDILTN